MGTAGDIVHLFVGYTTMERFFFRRAREGENARHQNVGKVGKTVEEAEY